jgi:mannose-6-phosphate isomerase-like protein (cupin superfamily)
MIAWMGVVVADLLDGQDWVPLALDQQDNPTYFWHDGRPLSEAPVDFAATFEGAMWMTRKPIRIFRFNRNPLRVRPNFVVPRHHHSLDEMVLVLEGEYSIAHGEDPDDQQTVRIGAGEYFISRAGTPYTMTAGDEGVTYIETWPAPLPSLLTYWHEEGWVTR